MLTQACVLLCVSCRLVAAESFPTDVRATFQGISAAMGKVGAIIADIVFAYVDKRMTFILSAVSGLIGKSATAASKLGES